MPWQRPLLKTQKDRPYSFMSELESDKGKDDSAKAMWMRRLQCVLDLLRPTRRDGSQAFHRQWR